MTLRPAVLEAAERISAAAAAHAPCAPVRDLIGAHDLAAAYAVQRHLAQARVTAGAVVVGHKIGLTSEAVQRQLRVERPHFGVLFDDMEVPYGIVQRARPPQQELVQR